MKTRVMTIAVTVVAAFMLIPALAAIAVYFVVFRRRRVVDEW